MQIKVAPPTEEPCGGLRVPFVEISFCLLIVLLHLHTTSIWNRLWNVSESHSRFAGEEMRVSYALPRVFFSSVEWHNSTTLVLVFLYLHVSLFSCDAACRVTAGYTKPVLCCNRHIFLKTKKNCSRLMEKQFPVKAVCWAVFFRAVKPVEKLTPDVGSEVHLCLYSLAFLKKQQRLIIQSSSSHSAVF